MEVMGDAVVDQEKRSYGSGHAYCKVWWISKSYDTLLFHVQFLSVSPKQPGLAIHLSVPSAIRHEYLFCGEIQGPPILPLCGHSTQAPRCLSIPVTFQDEFVHAPATAYSFTMLKEKGKTITEQSRARDGSAMTFLPHGY